MGLFMPKTAIILLAAGSARRMGQPKALLDWNSVPLIIHQLKTLEGLELPIIVVLGAHYDHISAVTQAHSFDSPVQLIYHADHSNGMGSSIACGVKEADRRIKGLESVLITAIDQPFVTTEYLKAFLSHFESGSHSIQNATSTEGWKGIPVIFKRSHFEDLKKLSGDDGAKSIVRRFAQQLHSFKAFDGLTDIDTYEDYLKLKPSAPDFDH